MPELIDWVENQAIENLKERIKCAEDLSKESNTTLTVLLAGIGAATAYASKILQSIELSKVGVSACVLMVYFSVLSILLIIKCIKIKEIPSVTNEPENIYIKGRDFLDIREHELKNIQQRINQAVKRNNKTTAWLNTIRLCAALSPIISFLAPHLQMVFRLFY